MFKKNSLLVFLFLGVCFSTFAQLPPVFNKKANERARTSKMTTTYLTPKRIVWQSDSTGKYIKNAKKLLQKGSGQVAVNDKGLTHFISTKDHKPGILLDYGKELHGGIKISMGIRKDKTPLKLRVRFGESAEEAMVDVGGKQNAINEHSLRDFIIEVPWLGSVQVGNSGFRFVRIDVMDADQDAPIEAVEAAFVYRDLPYLGSFHSSDSLLNKIWETGAYTVQLNMQNYLWDGIKRDRLVWVGDMHPEVMTINTVFGANKIVPKTLDLARDQFPLPQWMNGISSYSMWWLLIQKAWYDYHGNLDYLKEQKTYMIGLLDRLSTFIDKDNKEILNGGRFLDWPTSVQPKAVHAGLQAMMIQTFEAGSAIMKIYGEPKLQKKYAAVAKRLKKHIPQGNKSKQAAALMALSGLANPKKMDEEVLKKGGARDMSTFYGYYILEAMAKADDYKGALTMIRDYWGGMLDLGATTFWEDFNVMNVLNSGRIDELTPQGKKDIQGDFGKFCYVGFRRSLCHGWASGPTPWLTEHVLGIKIMDGGNTAKIDPHLGDLKFAEGSIPTKFGVLKVKHTRTASGIKTEVDAPKGLKVIQTH